MKEVLFDGNGPGLRICISFGFAQIGSYRLRVWNATDNGVALDKSGNNQNPADDCHDLELPALVNNGRLVQCELSIVSPDPQPGDQYSATLTFSQGTKKIDDIHESGPMNGNRVTPEFWATLKAK